MMDSVKIGSTIDVFPFLLPNAEFTRYEGFVIVEQRQFFVSFQVSQQFACRMPNRRVSLEHSLLDGDVQFVELLRPHQELVRNRLCTSYSVHSFFVELKDILVRAPTKRL
jgi:hypothetical protein